MVLPCEPTCPTLVDHILGSGTGSIFQTLFRAAGARDSSGNDHRNTGVYDPHPDCTSALVDLVGKDNLCVAHGRLASFYLVFL